jgi:citrate lyase beta subunit
VPCGVFPLIESPTGIFNALEIARASPRVTGLGFGTADFRLRMGMDALDRDPDLGLPRYTVAMAANAADLFPMDAPYMHRNDPEGLRADAERMRAVGYRGKFCSIPEQIEPINDVFTPSDAEIERAKRVLRAFDEAEAGLIYVDDTSVDRPVVSQQRGVLRRAIEAGIDIETSGITLE